MCTVRWPEALTTPRPWSLKHRAPMQGLLATRHSACRVLTLGLLLAALVLAAEAPAAIQQQQRQGPQQQLALPSSRRILQHRTSLAAPVTAILQPGHVTATQQITSVDRRLKGQQRSASWYRWSALPSACRELMWRATARTLQSTNNTAAGPQARSGANPRISSNQTGPASGNATQQAAADPGVAASIDTASLLTSAAVNNAAAGTSGAVQQTLQDGTSGAAAAGSGSAWQAQQQQQQQQQQGGAGTDPSNVTSRSRGNDGGSIQAGQNISTLGFDSSNSSSIPLIQFPALRQTSSFSNSSSSNRTPPLKTLLQGISLSWQQRQQLGSCPLVTNSPDASDAKCRSALTAAWQDAMQQMQQHQPELSGFAQLAGSHPLLLQMVANNGLPAAVLAPSNTALETLLQKQQQDASTLTNYTDGPKNSSWQQFVANAQKAPAESILLLLRHVIPVRQPQLLDAAGAVSHQLLGKPSAAGQGLYQQQPQQQQQMPGSGRKTDLLVFNSLVVQTALGSYIQVSDLPDIPSAYRLELAAAAAVVSTSNATNVRRLPWQGSPQDLGSAPVVQQQLLLANRNKISNPNETSAASTLSHLHVGVHLRALSQPYQVNHTRLMVVRLNGVLDGSDEVVNGGTAASLRGAFGWSPEDEQALLSRVYLDPESTYWARTQQVLEASGGNNQQGSGSGTSNQQTQAKNATATATAAVAPASPSPAPPSPSVTASQGGAGRGRRKLTQGSNDGSGSNAPPPSLSPSPSPSLSPTSPDNSNSSNSTSSSSSRSSSSNVGANNSASPAPGASTSPAVAPPTGAAAADGLSISTSSSSTHSPKYNSSTSTLRPPLSPAAIAELIARQQQQLMEFHMADALAANLMTIEALSAWTAAAVTQPAAVFAPLQQQGVYNQVLNDASSSSGDDGSEGYQCLADWGSPCGMPWGCVKTGSSSTSNCTRCCYLEPAAATTTIGSQADPVYSANNSSSTSNVCPLIAAAAAGLGGNVAVGRCAGWQFHESSGTIQTAMLVGLSPYQLYPSLGQYDAAYDKDLADLSVAIEESDISAANSTTAQATGVDSPAAATRAASVSHTAELLHNTTFNTSSSQVSHSNSATHSGSGRRLQQSRDLGVANLAPGVAAPPPWQPLSVLAARQLQPDTPGPSPAAAQPAGPAAPANAPVTPAASNHDALSAPPAASSPVLPQDTVPAAPAAAVSSSPAPAPPAAAAAAAAAAANSTSHNPASSPPSPSSSSVSSPAPQPQAATGPASSNASMTGITSGKASSSNSATNSSSSNSGSGANTDVDTGTASVMQFDPPSSPSALPPALAGQSNNTTSNMQHENSTASSAVLAADATTPAAPGASSSSSGLSSGPGDGSGVWVRVPTDQLSYLSVLELSGLLAEGRVDPQQLVEMYSSRLRRYDDLLHPTVTFTDALAVQQASAAVSIFKQHNTSFQQSPEPTTDLSTVSISRGLRQVADAGSANSSVGLGPARNNSSQVGTQGVQEANTQNASASQLSLLTGILYGLKDLFAVPGYPTSWGLAALKNRTINTPSWAFSSLSGAAGAVLLAKTASGELAWGDVWFDDITTRNPWNVNTGSCGSSAGSAVAVAAGLLPFAIGSETWGSVVCPATTVGVTAFRPTGGSIPGHGMMQVSYTLDKTGIFCRQALDCAVVADALMDHGHGTELDTSNPRINPAIAVPTPRLHQQDARNASQYNYTSYQSLLETLPEPQKPKPWVPGGHTLLPPTFEQLPALSTMCIGYLDGTNQDLIDALTALKPACLKGPLPAPGSDGMVRDVLSTILQVDVSVSFEGLWLEGYISQDSHWYPLIQLGQVSPAAAYVKAHRLRALLLSQTKAYFKAYGIHALLKASRSDVGTDGLAALLDMPELLLPVGFTVAQQQGIESATGNSSQQQGGRNQQQQRQQQQQLGNGVTDPEAEQVWLQPDVNSIIALPGHDAAVVAVGAAFQSITAHHLVHPSLPAV